MVCGDFNAHSTAWGSKYESGKGNRLNRWMENNNFVLINEGNAPTCVRPQGTSIVDLTWSTPVLVNRIKEWKVDENTLSLSDHSYITFRINMGRANFDRIKDSKKIMDRSPRWKMDTLDQKVFDEVIESKCSMDRAEGRNEDEEVKWIQQTMIEAADVAMRRVKKNVSIYKKQVYWWSEELSKLRNICIVDRRRWTKMKIKKKKKDRRQGERVTNLDILCSLERKYRESKKKVVKAIFKAKEEAWKSLIDEIDKDQWGIPYKAVMNRLRAAGPGLTETLDKGKLEKLILKLFPREMDVIKEEEVRVITWKEEWEIDSTEVCNVIRRKKG